MSSVLVASLMCLIATALTAAALWLADRPKASRWGVRLFGALGFVGTFLAIFFSLALSPRPPFPEYSGFLLPFAMLMMHFGCACVQARGRGRMLRLYGLLLGMSVGCLLRTLTEATITYLGVQSPMALVGVQLVLSLPLAGGLFGLVRALLPHQPEALGYASPQRLQQKIALLLLVNLSVVVLGLSLTALGIERGFLHSHFLRQFGLALVQTVATCLSTTSLLLLPPVQSERQTQPERQAQNYAPPSR